MQKYSDFGKEVKKRLVDLDKQSNWLIAQVRERTGDYFDSSYLHKILTGKVPSATGRNGKPSKVEVIRDILEMRNREEHK